MAGPEVRPEWFDKLYQKDPNFWLGVNIMLELMMKAGLPMASERLRQFDLQDPETVGLYVMDLADAGITMYDLEQDGHNARRMLRFFPSSAELVTVMLALREKREPRGIISNPVYIYQDGCVRVASMRVAEKLALPYWKDQVDCEVANGLRQPMKALPPGGTKAFLARLDGLADKMTGQGLPDRFPAKEKLEAAGLTSLQRLRMAKELPDTLDEAERKAVDVAMSRDYENRHGMTKEKRAEIEAELAQLAIKNREREAANAAQA